MHRSAGQTAYSIYPLTNYSFGSKDKKLPKENNMDQKMARLKANYEKKGMRRSVEGILVVQEHNHPHIIMLQLGVTYFKLPGGRLRPGEDEAEGLKRKLTSMLSPTNPQLQTPWDIGECIGTYYRPNFDTMFYPYLPSHITRPKECKKMYMVPLPEKAMFAHMLGPHIYVSGFEGLLKYPILTDAPSYRCAWELRALSRDRQVPANMKLVAVPLFEIYDNPGRYGPVISAIPPMLSRFRLNAVSTIPAQLPE